MSQRIGETYQESRDRINAARRKRYAEDATFKAKVTADNSRRNADPKYRQRANAATYARIARLSLDPAWKERDRLMRRATLYGVTTDQLLAWQAEGCGICGRLREPNGRNLHVDHDHACCDGPRSCGKCVRGVLCYLDNLSYERFSDSPRVIAYLKRTKAGRATLARMRKKHR